MEDNNKMKLAAELAQSLKIAVMIVAYNAERHIESVLKRIPPSLAPLLAEIYVLDDASSDATFDTAIEAGRKLNLKNLKVYRNKTNQGYGGNQKIGYTYAVENNFDLVFMLHGDGQYPPEHLPQMISAFADEKTDVVLGSRMLKPRDALKGGMPLYKWVGNQVLTKLENMGLGVNLSEFHTGYRGYRVSRLKAIPYVFNSNDFHFDTDILIQFLSADCKIEEIPIPTHYGDEICHVNGVAYALNCLKSVIRYRLFKMGLCYDPLLDFNLFETDNYYYKKSPNTLHQYILNSDFSPEETVLDLGAASGYISSDLANKVQKVIAVDTQMPKHAGKAEAIAYNLDGNFDQAFCQQQFDTVLALDVIEHLKEPEETMLKIARIVKPGGKLMASTANIAFMITRLGLLLGSFNYGKRGILDLTHTRLFTVGSFKKLFRTYGFEIENVRGFGPPIRDLVSSKWPFNWLDSIFAFLARTMPRLFAYNFLIEGKRLPTHQEIYAQTLATKSTPSDRNNTQKKPNTQLPTKNHV